MATNEPKSNAGSAQNQQQVQQRRPNEAGTVQVEAHMRIFDPQTGQTIVEGRE